VPAQRSARPGGYSRGDIRAGGRGAFTRVIPGMALGKYRPWSEGQTHSPVRLLTPPRSWPARGPLAGGDGVDDVVVAGPGTPQNTLSRSGD